MDSDGCDRFDLLIRAKRLIARGEAEKAEALLSEHAELRPEVDAALEQLPMNLLLDPHLIQGYEIQRRLPRGGQGVVYQGIRTDDQRVVAIKILYPKPSKAALGRLARECEILRRLRGQPGIPRFVQEGMLAFFPFLVMDYIDGDSLSTWLAERERSQSEKLVLFCRICDTVSIAHGLGAIHRDLKPNNIIVNNGAAYVLDFGLAVTDNGPVVTETGIAACTPEWAAPEQKRGEQCTQASDIFALGRILEFLLRADRSKSQGHENNTRIPGRLRAILEHCTLEDPRRRYASVAQLKEDVARHVGRKASPIIIDRYLIADLAKRFKWWIGTASAIALLVIAVVINGYNTRLARQNAIQEERLRRETSVLGDASNSRAILVRLPGSRYWEPLIEFAESVVLSDYKVFDSGRGNGVDAIVIGGIMAPFDDQGTVLCAIDPFTPQATADRVIWRLSLNDQQPWTLEADLPFWHVEQIWTGDLLPDPGEEIVVLANHPALYPSRISVVSAQGEVIRTFWHAGQMLGFRVVNQLLGDEKPGIIAWGLNNKLDSIGTTGQAPGASACWDIVSAAMVLDPERLAGTAPPELASSGLMAYAFLDRPYGTTIRYTGEGDPNCLSKPNEAANITNAEAIPCESGDVCIEVTITRPSEPTRVTLVLEASLHPIDSESNATTTLWRPYWNVLVKDDQPVTFLKEP